MTTPTNLYPIVKNFTHPDEYHCPIVDLGVASNPLPLFWEAMVKSSVSHIGETATLSLAMGDNAVTFGYPCHLTTKKELAVKLYSDIIKQRTKHDKAFAKLIEQAQDKSKGLAPPKPKP